MSQRALEVAPFETGKIRNADPGQSRSPDTAQTHHASVADNRQARLLGGHLAAA
jgi:hypothetical protein